MRDNWCRSPMKDLTKKKKRKRNKTNEQESTYHKEVGEMKRFGELPFLD